MKFEEIKKVNMQIPVYQINQNYVKIPFFLPKHTTCHNITNTLTAWIFIKSLSKIHDYQLQWFDWFVPTSCEWCWKLYAYN